jgi:hypothetical protein
LHFRVCGSQPEVLAQLNAIGKPFGIRFGVHGNT